MARNFFNGAKDVEFPEWSFNLSHMGTVALNNSTYGLQRPRSVYTLPKCIAGLKEISTYRGITYEQIGVIYWVIQ